MSMTDRPDLRALQMVTVVAEQGSLTAAGRALGVSQQAVSARMRALEAELGLTLMVRTPRGTRLTEQGLLLAGWAAVLLGAVDDFAASVAALQQERARVLRLAASLTVAEHLVPGWLQALRRAASPGGADAAVQLTAANSEQVAELVRSGDADLGLIETPALPADLTARLVGHDELVLVVAPDHPWASRQVVSPAVVAATPLVLRERGSGTRASLEAALSGAGHPRRAEPAAELASTLSVRATTAGGLAPAVLSALAVAEDLRRRTLVRVRVRGLRMVRPLHAVWQGRRPSPAATRLLEVARAPERRGAGTRS